jgi:hypothetical protein
MGRIELADYSSILAAGHRGKCNRIKLSECPSAAEAGHGGKCNRIELSECLIVIWLGPQSLSWNRHPGLWPVREETAFQVKIRIAPQIPVEVLD